MIKGRRIEDNMIFDDAGTDRLRPGDYGRALITKTRDGKEIQEWDWFVIVPTGGAMCHLWVNEDDRNGNRHIVTEHEDGTITVEGSIMGRKVSNSSGIGEYHGWLGRGKWETA